MDAKERRGSNAPPFFHVVNSQTDLPETGPLTAVGIDLENDRLAARNRVPTCCQCSTNAIFDYPLIDLGPS
jgi:hypothetical protein